MFFPPTDFPATVTMMRRQNFSHRRLARLTGIVVLLLGHSIATADEDAVIERYRLEIKPVLAKRCYSCHGPEKQEGGLRLDTGASLAAGGDSGAAIIRGKPQDSLLLQRISAKDESERMPPEGPALTEQEQQQIRDWIAAGGNAPNDDVVERRISDHWAFQTIRRPTPPIVSKSTSSSSLWPQTAIDCFIAAELDAHQLEPALPAIRATLLRRLYLDLLGLVPPVSEVEAFERDDRPDAIDRCVDRMLSMPAYGERWGRHWLDQARYADSNGYTRDFGREIWLFRDWVIAAINSDKPFDEFTLEQFAGDLLPNARLDQIVATGFHRNTLINEEGGTDQEQFRVDAVADRVATTGSVWLGLTVGCVAVTTINTIRSASESSINSSPF